MQVSLRELYISARMTGSQSYYGPIPTPTKRKISTDNSFWRNAQLSLLGSSAVSMNYLVKNQGLSGCPPPRTKGAKTGRLRTADQVAKSRWLGIQSVNRVFALTLTLDNMDWRERTARWPGGHCSSSPLGLVPGTRLSLPNDHVC